jgi:hypothetical protein
MSVSVDGFITDRAVAFGWTDPNDEQFRVHLAQTREIYERYGRVRDESE